MSKHSTNKVLGIQCLFCAKDLLTPWCAYFAMALFIDTRKRDHKPILQGLLKNSQQAILADLKNILFPLTIENRWSGILSFCSLRVFLLGQATKGTTQILWRTCRTCIQLRKTLTKNILHGFENHKLINNFIIINYCTFLSTLLTQTNITLPWQKSCAVFFWNKHALRNITKFSRAHPQRSSVFL